MHILLYIALASPVVFAIYLYSRFVLVPVKSKAIVERLGKFSRIIDSGWHILSPVERLKSVTWNYNEEVFLTNGKSSVTSRQVTSQFFRMENIQLDLPPIDVISKEKLEITINANCTYKIYDLQKAIYEIDDLLANMQQIIYQAMRYVVSKKSIDELYGDDYNLTNEIMKQIQKNTNKIGVECTAFMIQSITTNKAITSTNEQRYVESRNLEIEIMKHTQEHSNNIKLLEMKRQKQEQEYDLEKQKNEHKHKLEEQEILMELSKFDNRLKCKSQARKNMLELGFTHDQIVQLECTEKLTTVLPKSSVIYMPNNIFKHQLNYTPQ